MAKTKVVICPYCGETQAAAERCRMCLGLFEPLSRQATHNAMGPWFVRDPARPFRPGCSYETLIKLLERGQINKHSIIRGPTTKQFWTVARRTPGVSHLLGYCHNCDASVDAADHGCHACGVPFGAYLDRNYLGLPEVRPLPWEADYEEARETDRFGRSVEWPRSNGPTGLSSFASDAELLGAAGSGLSSADPKVGGAWSATAAPATALAQPQTETVLAGYDVELTTRALERRVAEQRRTIRFLVVALIALVVLSITAAMAVRLTRPSANTAMEVGPTATERAAPDETAETEGARDGSESVPASETAGERAPSANVVEPDASPGSSSSTLLPAEYAAEFERAGALIARARDESHAREARLTDYQEAIAILENILASTSDAPDEVASLLEAAQREHERLSLEEFFP